MALTAAAIAGILGVSELTGKHGAKSTDRPAAAATAEAGKKTPNIKKNRSRASSISSSDLETAAGEESVWEKKLFEQFQNEIEKILGGKMHRIDYGEYKEYKKFGAGDLYFKVSSDSKGENLVIRRVGELNDKREHEQYMDDEIATIKKLKDGSYIVESGSRFTINDLKSGYMVDEPYIIISGDSEQTALDSLRLVVEWERDYRWMIKTSSPREMLEHSVFVLKKWGDQLDPAARESIKSNIQMTKELMDNMEGRAE